MASSPSLPLFAAIQLTTTDNIEHNLAQANQQLRQAKQDGAMCAVLPEMFAWMGAENDANNAAETFGSGLIQEFLSNAAKIYGIWIIGGSQKIRIDNDLKHRNTNTTLVYQPNGEQIARYDKIHLFDANVKDGSPYLESNHYNGGEALSLIDLGFTKVGLSICYDIRFPAMYHALQKAGANIVVVPAAFTVPTGQAHWEVLLRARAIENQIYIIAAAQSGTHTNGRKTWGHSMCIDPWGEIITQKNQGVGNIYCEYDAEKISLAHQNMPISTHHRPNYYKITNKH